MLSERTAVRINLAIACAFCAFAGWFVSSLMYAAQEVKCVQESRK